jgi:hypothetical protein
MNCSEFNEISEAYLCDELLVETNILLFRHLEDCRKCRRDFAARRALRSQMSSSVRACDEFRIDPTFAGRLTAELKAAALYESSWRGFLVPRILVPLFAGVLIAGILGFGMVDPSFKRTLSLIGVPSATPIIEGVGEMLADAVGHHRTCAVEKLKIWERMAKTDPPIEPVYLATIVKPLQENVSDRIELLHTDDCFFEGKAFVHVILKDGGKVVSVFFAKAGHIPGNAAEQTTSILSQAETGYQVAAFRKDTQTVFVVSDLTETENLSVARTLLNAWRQV